jgi:hypothetical protein
MKSAAFVVTLVVAAFGAGCSASPSGPSRGQLSVTSVTAVGSTRPGGGYSYAVTFTARETGGVDTTVMSIDVRVFAGTAVLAGSNFGNGLGFAVPKNGSYRSDGQYVIDDPPTPQPHPYADIIRVTLNYVDKDNNSGSVSGSGTILPNPM